MGHLYPSVKDAGLAKDDVFGVYFVFAEGTLAIDKPYEVHHPAAAIGEVGYHTLLAGAHLKRLEAQNIAAHLYERHVARQLLDAVES